MWILYSFLWYQFIAHVGVSAGLHRYFAHKAFKAGPWFEWLVLFVTNLIGLRSPIGWMGAHRMHHHHSDTENDPHSPKYKGFWNILLGIWQVKQIPSKYVKDLYENPRIVFYHKHWGKLWFLKSAIAFLISPYLFLGITVLPTIWSLIGFGLINAGCHKHGEARNWWPANFMAAGEGYHLGHHEGNNLRFHKYDHTGAILEWLIKLKILKASTRK